MQIISNLEQRSTDHLYHTNTQPPALDKKSFLLSFNHNILGNEDQNNLNSKQQLLPNNESLKDILEESSPDKLNDESTFLTKFRSSKALLKNAGS